MAWDVEMLFGNSDDKDKKLPFLIASGQFSASRAAFMHYEEDATPGPVVGLFVRDQKTRQLIRDRDPIILDMFIEILDEIDEITTVYWFSSDWKDCYDNIRELAQDAMVVLRSKYASQWRKNHAEEALEYAMDKMGRERNKASRKPTKKIPGFVYVLKADNDLFKIGMTRSVNKRIKQLAVSLPYELELVETIETDDCQRLETNLHQRFQRKRKRGEWFELDETDLEYIKGLGA